MKSLTKFFLFVPVMFMSLTACGAKLDESAALERANSYSVSEVETNYKSVDVKFESKINKNTGVFADDGLMGIITLLLKEATNTDEKNLPVEEYVFTKDSISDLISDFAFETEDAVADVTYYAYKGNGLKVDAIASSEGEEDEGTYKVNVKATMYVLDDGRIEKMSGSMLMDFKGESMGVSMEGVLDFSFTATLKWNAA